MATQQYSPRIHNLLQGLERNPKNPMLWWGLVDAHLEQQHYKQAAEAAMRLLSVKPTIFADVVLKFEQAALYNPYNLSIRLALADVYQFRGDTADAVHELEDVLELDPNRIEAAQSLSRLYYKLGRGPEVIQLLDGIHDWSKADLNMLLFMAKAYFRERQWQKAAQLFERAYSVESDISILKNLYEIYLQEHDFDHLTDVGRRVLGQYLSSADWLRDQLEKTLRQYPAYRDGLKLLSKTYMVTVQPDEAVRLIREQTKLEAVDLTDIGVQLRELLQQFPQFPAALYELALYEIRRKNYTQALMHLDHLIEHEWVAYQEKLLRCLELILEAQPDQVLALRMLGDVYVKQGKINQASEAYRRLMVASPGDRPVLLLRLQDWLKQHPDALPLLMLGVELAIDSGDLALADRWLQRLKQSDEAAGYVAYVEALLERQKGRHGNALVHLKQASAASVADVRVHQAVRQTLQLHWQSELEAIKNAPDARDRMARLYYDMGRVEQAAEIIQQSGTEDVGQRFLLARCFKELGRYDLALRQLRLLSELDPRRVLFELGSLQEVVGDLEAAIDTYKNLQQLDLNFPGLGQRIESIGSTTLVNIRGKLLVPLQGYPGQAKLIPFFVRNSEVEQWIKKAKVNLSPSLANPHNDRAVAHMFSGQWKAAEEELLLAQNLDPGLTAVQVNWTSLCLFKADWEGAASHWEKAQHLNSKLGILHHLKGILYLMRGESKEAGACFQHGLVQERRSVASCLNLGDVLYAAGKIEPAIEMWERHYQSFLLPELAYRRLREVKYAQFCESLLQPVRPAK